MHKAECGLQNSSEQAVTRLSCHDYLKTLCLYNAVLKSHPRYASLLLTAVSTLSQAEGH